MTNTLYIYYYYYYFIIIIIIIIIAFDNWYTVVYHANAFTLPGRIN